MPIPFIAQLLVGIVLNFVGYLLMPKPKQPKPPAMKDMESPTAESGRPIPVVFGSVTIESPNNLGHWDKSTVTRQVATDSGGKK